MGKNCGGFCAKSNWVFKICFDHLMFGLELDSPRRERRIMQIRICEKVLIVTSEQFNTLRPVLVEDNDDFHVPAWLDQATLDEILQFLVFQECTVPDNVAAREKLVRAAKHLGLDALVDHITQRLSQLIARPSSASMLPVACKAADPHTGTSLSLPTHDSLVQHENKGKENNQGWVYTMARAIQIYAFELRTTVVDNPVQRSTAGHYFCPVVVNLSDPIDGNFVPSLQLGLREWNFANSTRQLNAPQHYRFDDIKNFLKRYHSKVEQMLIPEFTPRWSECSESLQIVVQVKCDPFGS